MYLMYHETMYLMYLVLHLCTGTQWAGLEQDEVSNVGFTKSVVGYCLIHTVR